MIALVGRLLSTVQQKESSMTQKIASVILLAALVVSPSAFAEIKKGDKLQTLSNLHPDMAHRLIYTINYQLPGLIPVCSEVVVKSIGKDKMEFEYSGLEYTMEYEKYTKGAGVAFQDALANYFGPACDQAKLKAASKLDKDGIASGQPSVGMTKDGILLALGRPPVHATANLQANYWLYWRNRYGKMALTFDEKGKVTDIK